MEHRWTIIQRNGEVITGQDSMPPELCCLNCKTFILRLPGLAQGAQVGVSLGGMEYWALSPDIEMEVPIGFGLVFKRRNQFDVGVNMTPIEGTKRWKYIVGIEPLKQERSEPSPAHPP